MNYIIDIIKNLNAGTLDNYSAPTVPENATTEEVFEKEVLERFNPPVEG